MVEKIKLALERAYQERGSVPNVAPAPPPTSPLEPEVKQDLAVDTENSVLSKAQYCLVDANALPEKRIIAAEDSNAITEQFRLLRSKLLYLSKMEHISTVGITSPGEGEGKTLTAVNLAISLARSGETNVVLIDGDVSNPSIHRLLGVQTKFGLVDMLGGHIDIQDVIVRLSLPNLWLIPGREENINLLDQASTTRVEQLVAGFSVGTQSIVVIDLPPVLGKDDTMVFASNLDAVIMVVEEGRTKSEEVTRACGLLQQCNLIGTVLNKTAHGL